MTATAVELIDEALPATATRHLIDAAEVQALLLDIRNLLTATETDA